MSNQLLLRRRMMASSDIEPASDGLIWAYYYVSDTENPTTILTTTNNIADIIINGVSQGVVSSYTFPTEGRNLVKIKLVNNTFIGDSCFKERTELVEIHIPYSVYVYEQGAFNNCNNAVFDIKNRNIKLNVNYYSISPFYNCAGLSGYLYISIYYNRTRLCQCFSATNLERVKINGIETLWSYSFNLCTNLSYFEADSSLSEIKSQAFRRNNSTVKTTYVFHSTTPPTLDNYNFDGNMISSGSVIYVPYSEDHSILNAYKAAQNWSYVAACILELNENGEIPS